MAAEATARLYDVDEDTVVFKKLNQTQKYDQGVITFRARPGKLIDLDKLHESIWATRLSGGTRSGLVRLEVVAVGKAFRTQSGIVLKVSNSDRTFQLEQDPGHVDSYVQLISSAADSNRVIRVTGLIDHYQGRWPDVLRNKPAEIRQILVKGFEFSDGNE